MVLKDGMGLAVFLEMEEVADFQIESNDILITELIYLRIDKITSIRPQFAIYWISSGIRDLAQLVYDQLKGNPVCFNVKQIGINYTAFQLETLYCAAQGWIGRHYNITIPEIEVYHDENRKRFIYPSLPSLISKEKIQIYRACKGNIDSFRKSMNKKTNSLMTASDFAIIDELKRDFQIIEDGLASEEYTFNFENKVLINCDLDLHRDHLLKELKYFIKKKW